MKTILSIKKFKNAKYGQNVENDVYHIVNNEPRYIGTAHYNTGSMRGHDHEAIAVAVEHKVLPKKCMDGSKTGYINYNELNKSFRIIQL